MVLVEHPKQHFLKLQKPCTVIFDLLSYIQLIQISEAGTQEHFYISNLTHSFDCKSYHESLQQPDLHHRVGFLSIPPLSLDNGLEQLKLLILFLNFLPRRGTDIFLWSNETEKLADSLVSSQN